MSLEPTVTFERIGETVEGWLESRVQQCRWGDLGELETAILIIDTDDGVAVGYHGSANGTELLKLIDHARMRIKRNLTRQS